MNRRRKRITIDGVINWIPFGTYDEIDLACNYNKIPYINKLDFLENEYWFANKLY